MNSLTRFHLMLKDKYDIPITGCSGNSADTVVIRFADSATKEQKDQASALAQTFDWAGEDYTVKRLEAYDKIPLGDQLDAIFKFATERLGLVPDATQPLDTPEGWAGRIQEIKASYPKP